LNRAVLFAAPFFLFAGTTLAASDAWPSNPQWQRYVQGPTNSDVYPIKIVSTAGAISNVHALLKRGSGVTTLRYDVGGTIPTIVLDYGKDVSGIPYFDIAAVSGSPTLHAAYSEGQQYLGTNGDGAPGQAADPSRADDFSVSKIGVTTKNLIQGGERFQVITLTTPGSLSLSSVGIHFSAFRADAKDYKGYFLCSSDELNRIWYDGAYTAQLDQLPPYSVAPPWSIVNGSLVANGGDVGLLQTGANWTDYTVTFQFQILSNQAGWVVRGVSPNQGYLLILDASNDTGGAPNTLQELSMNNGYATIANVPLTAALDPGTLHTVKTVVAGTTVTTFLDGQQIASFDSSKFASGIPVYTSGTFGIREYAGEEAEFNNLMITDPQGNVLLQNSLSTTAALNDFSVPAGGDPLSLIMDGAKRDRVVWSGDINVEGPTLYYSTAANEYIQQSLLLLGSYQEATGEAGSDVPPTAPLGTFPSSGYSYSASYSIYFVLNLADYYLYTGDKSFVEKEWPIVQRELAYNASNVNSQNLLITSLADGFDWHYYDGPLTGAVTEYNVLYYRALLDGAALAKAVGHADLAAGYEQQAELVKAAINNGLFNATTGVYDLSDVVKGTIAQDANASAVFEGVAPAKKVSSILANLKNALWTQYGPLSFTANTGFHAYISPYASKVELQARLSTGDTDNAFQLLHNVWGLMAADGPNYTAADWEVIAPDGTPGFGGFTSLAHGWASGATASLSGYVLGIRPVSAGYQTWIIQPRPGALSWALGRAPTPYGPIDLKWGQDSDVFVIQVDAPSGTSGTIGIPISKGHSKVVVNGKTAWENGQAVEKTFSAETDSEFIYLKNLPGAHYHIESR
jgi:alpha-L-rhamnosidase